MASKEAYQQKLKPRSAKWDEAGTTARQGANGIRRTHPVRKRAGRLGASAQVDAENVPGRNQPPQRSRLAGRKDGAEKARLEMAQAMDKFQQLLQIAACSVIDQGATPFFIARKPLWHCLASLEASVDAAPGQNLTALRFAVAGAAAPPTMVNTSPLPPLVIR